MSETVNWRKHELECMRMAADCMQLAGDVQNPALQSHFVRMARVWSNWRFEDRMRILERQPDTQTSRSNGVSGSRENFATVIAGGGANSR